MKRLAQSAQQYFYSIPEGFYVTGLDASDDGMIVGWCEANLPLTDNRLWTIEEFKEKMLVNPPLPLVPEHIFCAVERSTGKVAATAAACIDVNTKKGNLHMVSSRDEYRGLGLGKAVCTEAVKCFEKYGVEEADLNTDDFRIPAIAIYLSLGFTPLMYAEDMPERWEKVLQQIRLK